MQQLKYYVRTYFAEAALEINLGAVAGGSGVGGEALTPVLARVAVIAGVHSAGSNTLQKGREKRKIN